MKKGVNGVLASKIIGIFCRHTELTELGLYVERGGVLVSVYCCKRCKRIIRRRGLDRGLYSYIDYSYEENRFTVDGINRGESTGEKEYFEDYFEKFIRGERGLPIRYIKEIYKKGEELIRTYRTHNRRLSDKLMLKEEVIKKLERDIEQLMSSGLSFSRGEMEEGDTRVIMFSSYTTIFNECYERLLRGETIILEEKNARILRYLLINVFGKREVQREYIFDRAEGNNIKVYRNEDK